MLLLLSSCCFVVAEKFAQIFSQRVHRGQHVAADAGLLFFAAHVEFEFSTLTYCGREPPLKLMPRSPFHQRHVAHFFSVRR
jgi:hypothetical protein